MGGMGPAMGVGFGGFLSLWLLMMAAMMVPSVGHVATGYLRAMGIRSHGGIRAIRTAGLVGGYLLAWAAYGVPAFGMASLLGALEGGSPGAARGARRGFCCRRPLPVHSAQEALPGSLPLPTRHPAAHRRL